ncbi:unnamed protein product [Polarella glacialis]|uniref:SSD domain-containing protein n=1 Tax=Polarella glacialis TaxID=89957 RepID=A0A813JUQ6_POLGL|nr:unnamed protein product [Polarella glacialis]
MVERIEIPAITLSVLVCLILLSWLAKFVGPFQVWLRFLTSCPLLCLGLGILIPAGFSFAGLVGSGYDVKVDLDFAGYLAAEIPMQYYQNVADEASAVESRKLGNRRRRTDLFAAWNYNTAQAQLAANASSGAGRRLVDSVDGKRSDLGRAAAEAVLPTRRSWTWTLQLFYHAVDPTKGIFTKEALEEIRSFEQQLKAQAGYQDNCQMVAGVCDQRGSVVNVFFTVPNNLTAAGSASAVYDGSGDLADIPTVLEGLLRRRIEWWTDKDFNAQNLKSQYSRTTFYGGGPLQGFQSSDDRPLEQNALSEKFLRGLHDNFLSRADKTGKDRLPYQHVKFTWLENGYLREYEILQYVKHDILWSVGTFAVVGLLVLCRLRSLFIGFFAGLGVVLSFTTTFYFHYVVMDFRSLSIFDIVSLFLIVGIAADDILLIFNTYSFASQVLGDTASAQQKMTWAYKEAAPAMLVTTIVTTGSFYSNCFSLLTKVRRFGFFMGTLALWNYLLVLTIFPASILVNELYVAPRLRRWCCWCRGRCRRHARSAGAAYAVKDEDAFVSRGARSDAQSRQRVKAAIAASSARRRSAALFTPGPDGEEQLELAERFMAMALIP